MYLLGFYMIAKHKIVHTRKPFFSEDCNFNMYFAFLTKNIVKLPTTAITQVFYGMSIVLTLQKTLC